MTMPHLHRPPVPTSRPRRHPWPITLVLAVWLAPLQAQTPPSLAAAGAAVQGWLGLATPAEPPPVPDAPAPGQAEGLADLLARVLPRDPQVRAAMALHQAADERRRQARSRLGPALYLQVVGGQGRETEILQGPISRTTDRTEAGLRWNLYNSGNDSAELAPAAERLAAVRQLAEQVRQQAAAGKASPADATQADASLLDAEIAHEQLLADQASARAKLAAQVGGPVGPVQPLVLAAVPPAALQAGQPGLVTAAQQRAEAARARVRPPVSLLAPRIDLEVRQRLSDRTTPILTTEQKSNWQITARWDFPVLGETIARRNEGLRRAEAAEAEAERVAQGVRADLQSLDARIAIAERAVAVLERQLQQYAQLVRAGELQFDAGRRSLQQLIQLRDSRQAIAQRHADQVHRLLAARMRQAALTGNLLPALGLGN